MVKHKKRRVLVGHPGRAVRLRTALDVARALSRLYNELRRGEIEPGKAGRMAYVLRFDRQF